MATNAAAAKSSRKPANLVAALALTLTALAAGLFPPQAVAWFNVGSKTLSISEFYQEALEASPASFYSQYYITISSDHQEGARLYQAAQKLIAKKIPAEAERPAIDIRFYFGNPETVNPQESLGILGGIGVLSDANLIKLVMTKKSPEQLANLTGKMVHLFSLPPPRGLDSLKTPQGARQGGLYLPRLSRFINRGYGKFYMASNTAHLNIAYLKSLKVTHDEAIQHLPEQLVAQVKAHKLATNNPESVLILGTTQAWEGGLYDQLLTAAEVPYTRLAQPQEQIGIQDWINRVKAAPLDHEEEAALKSYIEALAARYQTTSILLGCTELPLGIESYLSELRAQGYSIYDSEDIFAAIIAQQL